MAGSQALSTGGQATFHFLLISSALCAWLSPGPGRKECQATAVTSKQPEHFMTRDHRPGLEITLQITML